jgi:hypothetical protein
MQSSLCIFLSVIFTPFLLARICPTLQVVFLFSDTQVVSESFVEDISNLLNTCEVPNLMQNADLVSIFENIRVRAKQAGMDGSKDALYAFFVQVRLCKGCAFFVRYRM